MTLERAKTGREGYPPLSPGANAAAGATRATADAGGLGDACCSCWSLSVSLTTSPITNRCDNWRMSFLAWFGKPGRGVTGVGGVSDLHSNLHRNRKWWPGIHLRRTEA